MKRYYEKRTNIPDVPNGSAFLMYLESLNRSDWDELISDLHDNPGLVRSVFSPPREEELLVYVSVFLHRISLLSKRLVVEAIESRLRRCVRAQVKERSSQKIDDLLFLLVPLAPETNGSLLCALIEDRELAPDTRATAASVLAEKQDISYLSFWRGLEVDEFPELIPTKMLVLSEIDPESTIPLLRFAERLQFEDLLDPVRNLLSSASRDATVSRLLLDTFRQIPQAVTKRLRDTLEDEADYWPQTMRAHQRSEFTYWGRICRTVSQSGVLPYFYTGYIEKITFSQNYRVPRCILRFLAAVRTEISSTLGMETSEFKLKKLPIGDISRLISRIASAEAILAEVAYLSETRKGELGVVRVGEVRELAAVACNDIHGRLQDILGAPLGIDHATVSMSVLLNAIWEENYEVIVQPGTDVSDIAEEYRSSGSENLNSMNHHHYYASHRIARLEQPNDISNALSRGNSVALINPQFVDSVTCTDGKNLHHFRVRYDKPLVVGFPVPGNDPVFADHLQQAVANALMGQGRWVKEFVGIMEMSGIILDNGPSICLYKNGQLTTATTEIHKDMA